MKRKWIYSLLAALLVTSFTACGGGNATTTPLAYGDTSPTQNSGVSSTPDNSGNISFKSDNEIALISREDGSGTRGAFTELFGLIQKGEDGSSKDLTDKDASIVRQTDVMLTTVSGDPYAIGYVSLGSLNDSVKALSIDGAPATKEAIKDGSYAISRPFFIATKGELSPLGEDFIDFILSADGQAVVSKSYIAVNDSTPAYAGVKPAGKLVIAGSSSVNPAMEKLREAYIEINPDADIEIQVSDSTGGMTATMDGICDIGMSSRHLKEAELAVLTPTQIAIDGIAVIVNNSNPISDLTKDQVKAIYTAEVTRWSELG